MINKLSFFQVFTSVELINLSLLTQFLYKQLIYGMAYSDLIQLYKTINRITYLHLLRLLTLKLFKLLQKSSHTQATL